MKIEIRVGDISSNKIDRYELSKNDNIHKELEQMYNFISKCNDCIIQDVDNFLLYALNNGIMAYIVSSEYKNELIPAFNPDKYKVYEIKDDGTEICLQTKKGIIYDNYFNNLMKAIMDDYYSLLNFYYC